MTSASLLAPWRSVVWQRQQCRLPRRKGFKFDKAQRVLWICWEFGDDATRADRVRAAEYVELLDLLLRVDRAAGLQELAVLLGDTGKLFLRRAIDCEEEAEELPFTIGVWLPVRRRRVTEALGDSWLLPSAWNPATRQPFAAARQQLLSAFVERFGVALDRAAHRIPLRVVTTSCTDPAEEERDDLLADDPQADDEITLLKVLQNVALASAAAPTTLLASPVFQPRDVSASFYSTRTTTVYLVRLAALLECGVALSDAVLSWLVPREGDAQAQRLALCRLLLPSRRESTAQTKHVHVNTRMELAGIRAISSALVDARTVRCVSCYFALDYELAVMGIDMPNELGRRLSWQWLAWALFSSDSSHAIEQISLDLTLVDGQDVEAMRHVLSSPHPLAVLTGRPPPSGSSSTAPAKVRLAVGTEITLLPSDRETAPTVIQCDDAGVEYRVLAEHNESSRLELLVPGWGIGSVAKRAATPVGVDGCKQARGRRSLKQLKIASITENPAVVLPLLELIGPQLTELHLDESDETLSAECLASLLRLCPSLTSLRVGSVTLATLQPLTEHFARTACGIKSLKFRCVRVVDMASVHRFLDALRGSQAPEKAAHALADKLEHLSLHIVEQTIADAERGPILQTCADALRSNRRLARCVVYIRSRSRFESFLPAFQALDREVLPVRRAPLPLRCKAAFLSVVQPPISAVASAVQRLDSHLLTQIFRFAGSCVERHCELILET
ncbi:hypothetical protein P43SY_007343 [Pythium insidiosum]|uniref:Uncharacterized protein n=1 Tax=Pythium insidiosum TaxID=114742 RepID=A0AAD5LLR3_PYTIN|nr:hypothetical protein P43SY_007343 [Pythium insidiosum]